MCVRGYAVRWLQLEMIDIVTALEEIYFNMYSAMGSHGAPRESSPKMTHKSLWALISENHDWLFRVWSMRALTADGSKWHAFSIDKHSLGGKKKSLLVGLQAASCDSKVMELSFFLFQIKIVSPLSSFLPAIFCHIKRVINSARWRHHYWNNLTVFFSFFIAPAG